MKYSHVLAEFDRSVWAILHEKFNVMRSFLRLKAAGGTVSKEEIALIKQGKRTPYLLSIEGMDPSITAGQIEVAQAGSASPRTKDGSTIAVLPLTGTICHRMGMFSEYSGGISTERFTQWLRAALADPSVKAIVIDSDSPGGTVDGVPELADEIYRSNKIKPIVGVANSMAASAAYWLLAQCSDLVVTPSGCVGSIGVFASHEDMSKMYENEGVKISLISAGKYKTEGNPYEPLSDDAREALQSSVNDYYDLFTKAVARGRNTKQEAVKAGFGEGRMLTAQQAVKEGMADRVGTIDQALAKFGVKGLGNKTAMAALAGKADTGDMDEGDIPGAPDDDPNEDKQCKCKCEGCRAMKCAECSNAVCDDEACEHAPKADDMESMANSGWQEKIAARRRQLELI
jgi:signal peptide peptidase SppA